MGVEVTAKPTAEPLLLAEAKLQLRVVTDDDDDLITALIQSARQHVESRTGRALITQTWRLTLDDFPRYTCQPIQLPGGRAQSISTVSYVDADGVTQTMDPATYLTDLSGEAARVAPAWNTQWPATRAQIGAVQVGYVVGYGAAADVPAAIKAAMKLLIGELYANRESWVDSRLAENTTVDNLIFPYRLVYP